MIVGSRDLLRICSKACFEYLNLMLVVFYQQGQYRLKSGLNSLMLGLLQIDVSYAPIKVVFGYKKI